MGTDGKGSPETLIANWNALSDADKLQVLPKILDSTPEWKKWAFSENGLINWLKWKFERSQVSFPL